MSRRLPAAVLALALVLTALGLAWLDRPLAEAVRASGFEGATVFVDGLGALDWLAGMRLWFYLAGWVALLLGAAGFALRREARWPRALVLAALVQFATIGTMILGKDHFGRLRPQQLLDGAGWSHAWYAGGASFPSGHSAFYFGLLLPLAAASADRRLRAALLAIASFAVLARIDMAKHFLSDVAASAAIAALYALLAAALSRRWLPAPARLPFPR